MNATVLIDREVVSCLLQCQLLIRLWESEEWLRYLPPVSTAVCGSWLLLNVAPLLAA